MNGKLAKPGSDRHSCGLRKVGIDVQFEPRAISSGANAANDLKLDVCTETYLVFVINSYAKTYQRYESPALCGTPP